jgi:ferric-dicitrate binding protein FerR (iron transport regulator)
MSVAEALLNVSAVPYALLNEPGDLAFVAYVATDWLGALDCEPGSPEHAAELKREQTDAHARAVALLEGALAIMRAADPQDPYRSFLANQSKESLT